MKGLALSSAAQPLILAVLVFMGILATGPAEAIVRRHDVPDAEYIAFANTPQFRYLGTTSRSDQNHWCSTTLIAPQWAITAAHCIDSGHLSIGDVALFGGSVFDEGESGEIDAILAHPSWGGPSPVDIALIHLGDPSGARGAGPFL